MNEPRIKKTVDAEWTVRWQYGVYPTDRTELKVIRRAGHAYVSLRGAPGKFDINVPAQDALKLGEAIVAASQWEPDEE